MTGDTYKRFSEATIDLEADGNMGSPALGEALEALVDRFSIGLILESLAVVASEKGEHLRTNWQDEGAAKCWDSVSAAIDKAMDKAWKVA